MNDDIHALSGAYAVDALDDVERARFERHLGSCPACQAEVASLTAAAAELAALSESSPPSGLRDRVLRDIATVRPLPPLASPATSSTPTPTQSSAHHPPTPTPSSAHHPPFPTDSSEQQPRPWATHPSRPWRWLVAAAAAVVLTLGGVGVWRSLSDQTAPPPTLAEQVLGAADATRVARNFPGGATATLVRSPSLHKAVLVTSRMPAAPEGRVYQLWLQDATGHMTSAGVMPAGSDQILVLEGDAAAAKAAGISVEPAGGSQQPTTDPIALFPFT